MEKSSQSDNIYQNHLWKGWELKIYQVLYFCSGCSSERKCIHILKIECVPGNWIPHLD
jgi:hypothetical protein